jgi:nicotinate phosphoribosyltransferase
VSLDDSRAYCRAQIAALPAALRALNASPRYEVAIAEPLRELTRPVDASTSGAA